MASGYDGSIRIDTRLDSRGFNAGLKGITASLSKLAGMVGVAFGGVALFRFGKDAVSAATELSSAMIGLQSVVEGTGNSFSAAQTFITDYIQDGLVPVTNAVTAYKNLLMRGYDTSQIEQVLTALKDSASFGRQASLTLGQAVQTATEGLKNENSILVDNSGVTKNVSLMWRDYAASIGTTVGALTKEQKIQAEVNGILEETRFQTGDAAKLSGGYAGEVAGLSTSFYNLKVAVGNTIIPILSKIIPYVKQVVDWFVVLFNTVARFISLFFSVKASMADVGASTGAAEDNLDGAADAAGNLADNTSKAGKAAKGALAAFDELNVLQMDTGAGTGVGRAGVELDIPAPTIEPGPLEEALDSLKDKVDKFKADLLAFFAPIGEAWGRLWTNAQPLIKTVGGILKWLWENVLVPFGTWVIQKLVPAVMDLIGALLILANDILTGLGPAWDWLWKNILKPAFDWIGTAVMDVLGWLIEKLQDLHEWTLNHQDAWSVIVTILAVVVVAILALLNPIWLVIAAIVAIIAIIANWGTIWEWIKGVAGRVWDWIVDKWKDAGEWFRTKVTEPIKDAFEKVLDWVQEKWETVFGAVKDFVKDRINNIIDFINAMIRAIASGINTIIGGLNSLKITVPKWVPGLGGESFGFNIPLVTAPQIPRLAAGAVIPPNAQFLAVLGDQRSGRNLEAPEGLIRQIIREEIGVIETNVRVQFEGSLGALVRELKPRIDAENMRIGRSLVAGGTA